MAAKNTHPVFAACVKYQIKWLSAASLGDVIMENSLPSQAKKDVMLLFSKTQYRNKNWLPEMQKTTTLTQTTHTAPAMGIK